MRDMISRFAPAPTGFLHLGHVVNAIYVWGVTKRAGGRVLLRIEDHDRQRARREFEQAILDDLDWLGFAVDEKPVRQSERSDIYLHALDRLRQHGLVYACDCSRARRVRDFDPGAAFPTDGASETRYPGTCAHRGLVEGPGRGLRVRLADAVERFVDLRHGPQAQRPFDQCGDLLVRDRERNWTYQFAATVDDDAQGVTLVIRGDDLLPSTGRQIQLARLLGRTHPPRFLHNPLVMKSPTQKLSKADGDTAIRDLRAKGWTAARVIGHAAARVGLVSDGRDLRAAEVSSIMSRFMEVQI
jgi:glutamyl-tRNA synthetase/glutamyl-Q tRNA(Asp) synthetase